MDTNLKKSHKFTNFIIALCVLIPALLVTCLYPQTGAAMEKLREKYRQEYESITDNTTQYYIERDLVNYAIEASYYMYGLTLQECEDRAVNFSALDHYGWDSDYHTIISVCDFIAVYKDELGVYETPVKESDLEYGEETYSTQTPEDVEYLADDTEVETIFIINQTDSTSQSGYADVYASGSSDYLLPLLQEDVSEEELQAFREAGIKAYLTLNYDAFGKLAVAELQYLEDNISYLGESVYSVAKNSVLQYNNNADYYGQHAADSVGSLYQVMPKNFKVVFAIREGAGFMYYDRSDYYDMSDNSLFLETGVIAVIIGIALLVAVLALILPFVRGLDTGWERLFCLPVEILLFIGIGGIYWTGIMLSLMASTNMFSILRQIENYGELVILGYTIQPVLCYQVLLVLNFVGWVICFLAEYVIVASVRQFLCRPIYYLKNRFLFVMLIKWMCIPFKKLYRYVTNIDIAKNLKNSILKIVIVNGLLVTLLCCMWFAGVPGVLIYSVGLYIVLKKFGSKLQAQYDSIIHAAEQMAEGDLKIRMEEDLGIFQPCGEALTKVSQGFSKAVAEEAKSQSMKTELITNVSHDLKTPLTAIITYVNLLKRPDLSEEERKNYVDTLDQKTQRLKVLIEDLFEVSKAHSGNIQMNFMDVDVVSLMKQVRLEMEDQIMSSGLFFRWNLPEEKLILHLDGQRTYRVFENLINNILKYSMPGSRVFIDITEDEQLVYITFKNISLAELDFDVERLTDRFVRGDQSRNTEGSGLGLAIAKSFVELQYGSFKIDVDGDLFKVTITWPRS